MAGDGMPDLGDLSKLDEIIKEATADDGEMPSMKEMFNMIDNADIDDELKATFRALLGGGAPSFFGGYGTGTLLGVVFVLLIFSLLLFFGYKLYKSIKDKELKREEKKKLKEMKKKK